MHGCKLGNKFISLQSTSNFDKEFIWGVIKIQDGNEGSLSDKEKFAWRKLKIADTNDEIYDVPSNMSISEKIEASRKRKRKSKSEAYMNTRFI